MAVYAWGESIGPSSGFKSIPFIARPKTRKNRRRKEKRLMHKANKQPLVRS